MKDSIYAGSKQYVTPIVISNEVRGEIFCDTNIARRRFLTTFEITLT